MSDDTIGQAELLELIEKQFTGTSFEMSKAAMKKLEAFADAADEAVARAKKEEIDDETNPADDEPDSGETYLPRDEGAPPRGI